jgi:hypothetical protein
MRSGIGVVLGVALFGCGNSGSGKRMGGDGGDGASSGSGSGAASGSGGAAFAGAKQSGGSGPGGGADAQGGVDAQGGDSAGEEPLPKPDLTGLVPTSGKWLMYSESAGAALTVLDLEAQQEHAANPEQLPMSSGSRSPNGAVFTFSGQETDQTDNFAIIRFAEAGFVPAKRIGGFGAEPGNFSGGAFDGRSRFFLATRFGATTGVEVVDSILGERVGFLPYGLSFLMHFAPHGPYFAYHYGGAIANDGRVASVTAESGLGEPFDLPKMDGDVAFSVDGNHVYFNTTQDEVTTFNYVDLPDTTPKQLAIAAAGETSAAVYPGPTEKSVVAWVQRADSKRGLVQAFFDGRARVDISDPETHTVGTLVSSDHQLVNLDYRESFELVQLEPLLRFPLLGKTVFDGNGPNSTGMVGRYLHYLRDGILRIATIDDGALVDGAVSEAGEETIVCPVVAHVERVTRLAYYNAARTKLAFVDMAARPPAVALRYDVSTSDATLSCPIWQPDGKAFLITEKTATTTRALVSNWSGATPTAPVLAKKAGQQLVSWAFSYR